MKSQIPQPINFKTLERWAGGRARGIFHGHPALFSQPLTLLAFICHHPPPPQLLLTYFRLILFVADVHTDLHMVQKKQHYPHMFQGSSRDDILLFLLQSRPANTEHVNDFFFHSNTNFRRKRDLNLFSYHACPHCWTEFGKLQNHCYGSELSIIKIISLCFHYYTVSSKRF